MLPSMPTLTTPDKHNSQNVTHDNDLLNNEYHMLEEPPQDIAPAVLVEDEAPFDVELDFINIYQSPAKNNEGSNTTASSTTGKREKKELTVAEKKKAKRKKQYLANITMLCSPNPVEEKNKKDMLALAYFDKLKRTLDTEHFEKVQYVFANNYEKEEENAVDLYKKLRQILCPKYQDLADEFLLFLTIEQANEVGRIIPFFIMNHMAKFLNNLETFFKDQPAQLRKIQRSILELNENDVTLEEVKNTVLPLLKSNLLLHDAFLQIFLEESPPTTLLNGAWETIDVNKELGAKDDEAVQESIVTENEDPTCCCTCHKIEEQCPLKQHCLKCGLRFAQGKIYCQTGKGLKLVKVNFPYNTDIDQNLRLGVHNKIEQTDCDKDDKIKRNKTPKPRAKKLIVSKEIKCADKKLSINDAVKFSCNKTSPTRRCRAKSLSFSNIQGDVIMHPYAKINAENMECTSNDGNYEKWTREEDKVILETFQQNFDQDVIQRIAQRLKNRTVQEINIRFERLMALLQEMETS